MITTWPAMRKTWVRSLGREDPLEKETDYPFQDSCLDESMDREAWQATDHGVLKSWTQLRDFFTLGTLYFPGGLGGNESSCSVGNLGLIPGLKKSTGERNGYPL